MKQKEFQAMDILSPILNCDLVSYYPLGKMIVKRDLPKMIIGKENKIIVKEMKQYIFMTHFS